jgi:hypothetical protein
LLEELAARIRSREAGWRWVTAEAEPSERDPEGDAPPSEGVARGDTRDGGTGEGANGGKGSKQGAGPRVGSASPSEALVQLVQSPSHFAAGAMAVAALALLAYYLVTRRASQRKSA